MKRHLLLTFCSLLLVLAVKGQNYQTVYPDRIVSFVDEENYYSFIRIDSTRNDNGLILYPFSVNQMIYDYCFSPTAGSWIGKEIIIMENGYNIFLNHESDSIKIYTLASDGELWLAYEKTGEMQIIATVTEHDVMNFMGLTDSVKVIEFQAYDTEGGFIENEINGMQVKISKNYGFVKTLNFYNFPEMNSYADTITELTLAGLSEPETGVQNFTWFGVHDFLPGDVLHILRQDGTWIGEEDGHFQITETRKAIQYLERFDYNDSIGYVYTITQRIHNQWIDSITVIEDTITKVIKPNPGFDKLPEEPIFDDFSNGDLSAYYYHRMKGGEHLKKMFFNYWFTNSDNDCWSPEHYDGVPHTTYYMNGLGGPYYPYQALFGSLLQQELVYYEKDGESWGTPLDVTNIKSVHLPGLIRVYPNPVKDILNVNIDLDYPVGFTIRLFDMNSRLVKSKELQPGDNVLNVSHLTPGLYFLIISNIQGVLEARKVLVQ